MTPLFVTPSGIRLALHVQPRASRSELAGLHGEALKIRLAAAPVDGAANEALLRFLAELLGVAPTAVVLVSGASSRRKVVEIRGVSLEAATRRLNVGSG